MSDKTGVLLVNLGTPDEPTPKAVRHFLAPFLKDRRVVDLSPWLWYPILYGVILPLRSKRVAQLYQSIWLPQGSPLLHYSQELRAQLSNALASDDIELELGMTYGNPSIAHSCDTLLSKGCTKLVVLPLYPQYSVSTTAAVFDAVTAHLSKLFVPPSLVFIKDYYQHPLYIKALTDSVKTHREKAGREHEEKAELLVFSFHGTPQRYADKGDPYYLQCKQTAQAVAKKLGLADDEWLLWFQSRFGKTPWLMPYCDEILKQLPQKGMTHVDIIAPSFAIDCLETIEEIGHELHDLFIRSGGQHLNYISALNDSQAHLKLMRALVHENA